LIWPEEYEGGRPNSPDSAVTIIRALEEIGRVDPRIGSVSASTLSSLIPIVMAPHVNEKLCAEFAPVFCDTDEVRVCSLILPEQGDVEEGGSTYEAAPATAKLDGEEKFASDKAIDVAHKTMSIMGRYRCDRDLDVEKHLRGIKMIQFWMGGKQLCRMEIARLFYECDAL